MFISFLWFACAYIGLHVMVRALGSILQTIYYHIAAGTNEPRSHTRGMHVSRLGWHHATALVCGLVLLLAGIVGLAAHVVMNGGVPG